MFGLNGFGNESPILGVTTNSDTRNYLTMDAISSGLDERRQRSTRGNEDDTNNTGLSPVLQDQIAKVNFEREMLEREKDLLQKTLPDFDPGSSKTALTAIQWIRKVETIASIYGWDSKNTLFHAMNRLNGAARFWFHGLEESLTDWHTFKTKLVEDFPVIHDDADIHFELSNRKKKFNESYETYVYTMKSIASKGTVSEQAVIKYIIMGLGDRELAKMLSLNDIRTTQDLLKRILQYVSTFQRCKSLRASSPNKIETKNDFDSKHLERKCYNCNEVGHISTNCPKPQKKSRCNTCNRVGHFAKDCQQSNQRKDTEESEKTKEKYPKVRKIESNGSNDQNYKVITIDAKEITAYIDLGSDVVTLRKSDADNLNIVYVPYNIMLRGFGQGSCKSVGKRTLMLNIDGVLIECEVLIVPDDSQEDSMIVGRSALAQTGIRVITEGDKLSIEKVMSVSVSTNPPDDIHCNPELSKTDQEQLIQLVNDFKTCFASNLHELGTTDLIDMNIKLTNNEVVRYRPYRLPYAQREEVDKIVDDMLSAGIISDSNSEYSSPVLLVKKKDGSNRLCIDYRRLNAITVKEYVPMQIIDEQLDLLSGNGYFTTLDLASGYMQVPVAKESRHLTSFVTTTGQYEFNRMPFGLVNAPSVFNRLMNMVTRKIGRGVVTIYMDDILIPSKTVGEGLEKLTLVLQTIRDLGLTLKLSKCRFLFTKLEYLGYEIDANGVRPGSRKVNAITDFPRPTNVHEVRQFLGLCNFFRRFVQDYAKIARYLTLLTKNDQRFIWSEDQENAFLTLKKILSEKPILSLYDPTAEFQVYCDASKQGLAGIYLQKKKVDAVWKPVCYFSRQTTEDEKKFHSYELEALAVVESLDRFRVYLLGRKFTVITDCNSLKTMMTKRDMSPRLGRWFLKLQEYDFDIQHRAGSRMQHVDALSRNPTEPAREVEVADAKIYSLRIDMSDWLLTMQLQDKKIVDIYETLKRKPTTNIEKQIHIDYSIENNRVCRKIGTNLRWVVPKPVIWKVIQSCHDDMGHCGVDRTVSYLQKYFWFPKMRKKVQTYINSCIRCAYHKTQKGKPEGELHRIERTPIPFHTCNIDHLGPFVSSNRESYVLHYQDNFTKYALFRATRNTKSKPVIDALKDIFAVFGAPTRLICDRGTAFTSKEFTLFCEENQITLIKTATATPRANGQVERKNQTLLEALRTTFNREDYKDWSQHLRNLQFALNAHKNKTTQMSPHDLLFSYHPRNAVQNQLILALGEPDDEINLEEAREEAVRKIHRQQAKDKQRFDEKHKRPTEYVEDDLVLITRNPVPTGEPTKLQPKRKGPYLVSKVLGRDRYLLTDIPGAQRSQRPFRSVFSSDHMRPYCKLLESDEDESDDERVEDDPNGSGPNCQITAATSLDPSASGGRRK
ncbi:retrovirus-related Pol polyprotein from transposon 297 [Tribolium castaneum]|uniref:retrovirus-related Pol polyprotein from transposon 297 n=1 Tax=Tribolium castaneum TaxID=7070 RepID=UPI00017589E2|nr:PREDICTED: retrovirus-related Pol polyprotein from transposon 297 [Tribolium castaneum]|eukprot:XP_001810078.1 PREDICTED: retrovirus-related Pol polyprotein from transposon 297 [Tribolium castaneum]